MVARWCLASLGQAVIQNTNLQNKASHFSVGSNTECIHAAWKIATVGGNVLKLFNWPDIWQPSRYATFLGHPQAPGLSHLLWPLPGFNCFIREAFFLKTKCNFIDSDQKIDIVTGRQGNTGYLGMDALWRVQTYYARLFLGALNVGSRKICAEGNFFCSFR